MTHKQNHSRSSNQPAELIWPRIVMRKWLNRSSKSSEYSADPEDDVNDGTYQSEGEEESSDWPNEARYKQGVDFQSDPNGAFPKSRRRKSETCRAQYIEAKEFKVSVNTWNVGGKFPPEDLDIGEWLGVDNPADIYVIGFQEIIPLNAGNIFGAEDNRPVPLWENVIRRTLNKVESEKTKFKCYSNPTSPSRFKPSDDVPDIEDEVMLESDGEEDEDEIHPFNEEESNYDDLMDSPAAGHNENFSTQNEDTLLYYIQAERDLENHISSQKTLEKVSSSSSAPTAAKTTRTLTRMLSGTERIGLCWPEPPLDLLAQCVSEKPNLLKNAYKPCKSFRTFTSFKSYINVDNRVIPEEAFLAELDLDSTLYRKRRSPYVRIVSKQMVGIFITIWVRRRLRKHIQNVRVSAVGVGAIGYMGNKGSISVSMSIYQTLFCFICTHLTSGEKEADIIKRNTNVHEIHKRTRFNSVVVNPTLPKRIENHDRIIWLGDLNYRLNLSYEKTVELISKNKWSELLECDQLVRELRKGRAFDGWSEGVLDFAPTYKYEQNSEQYYGSDPKVGRRTPACYWFQV